MTIFPKYVVKKSTIGGLECWNIYQRWIFWDFFLERWNSESSCMERVNELINYKGKEVWIEP